MDIFNQKINREVELKGSYEDKKLSTKKFRDLNPENKKRRKEPPKPWGQRERITILLIILLTAGASGISALSARSWKLPNLPRLKLPEVNLFKENITVIDTSKENQKRNDEIKNVFKEETFKLTGVYSFYVIELQNNYSFGLYEDEVFQAASLIKLPVIIGLYLESEKGNLNLETKYQLKNSDKVSGSGSLYFRPEGMSLTYRDLIKYMCKESDNTAFKIAVNLLGTEKIKAIITEIGLTKTNLETNETSAKDIGLLFQRLWEKELISQKDRDEVIGYLTDTLYENWLTKGVPENIKVAHKYGREVKVVNDAGIIFAEKPFVLVILTKGVLEKEADIHLSSLTSLVYQIETR